MALNVIPFTISNPDLNSYIGVMHALFYLEEEYGLISDETDGQLFFKFKDLTTGNVVIMGRRSYEEIGKPLPNRTTIVVSNTKTFDENNCLIAKSLSEAIQMAGDKDIYVSGGTRLYKEALPLVEKMYVTEIDTEIDGDAYFPAFLKDEYFKEIVEKFSGETPYTYVTYTRKDL